MGVFPSRSSPKTIYEISHFEADGTLRPLFTHYRATLTNCNVVLNVEKHFVASVDGKAGSRFANSIKVLCKFYSPVRAVNRT